MNTEKRISRTIDPAPPVASEGTARTTESRQLVETLSTRALLFAASSGFANRHGSGIDDEQQNARGHDRWENGGALFLSLTGAASYFVSSRGQTRQSQSLDFAK